MIFHGKFQLRTLAYVIPTCLGNPGPYKPVYIAHAGPVVFLKFLLTFTSRCLTISMSEGPKITLNNSFKIPAIGLGKFHKQICDHSCDLSTISRNLAVATWGSSRCCELCFKKWV